MPDLNEQVYSVLAGDADLNDLVGGRIWNTMRPQEEVKPALTFQRISTTPVSHSEGTGQLVGARYQLDGYAELLGDASAIVFRARDALQATFNSVQITRRDIYDLDARCYHVSMDVSVWGQDYI